MVNRFVLFILIAYGLSVIGSAQASAQPAAGLTLSDVFVSGSEGYGIYRIPALATAEDGSLLAFAEGRPNMGDPGASGDIDLVMKRSVDQGQTWSNLQVLASNTNFDYSNPTALADSTGKMWLFYNRWPTNAGENNVPNGTDSNSANIFYRTSMDHGQTWSTQVNITTQVKSPTWSAVALGPGGGVELRYTSPAAGQTGRLVIPGSRRSGGNNNAYVFYSDDSGSSWQIGGETSNPSTNEAEVVELADGQLLLDARQGSGSNRRRFLSSDAGQSWGGDQPSDFTITPVDSSLVRYSAVRDGHDRNRILFSGPAGPGREDLIVRISYDEGQTFENPTLIYDGSSAYSDLTVLHDRSMGVLFERDNHSKITFTRFGLDFLVETTPEPASALLLMFGGTILLYRRQKG